MKKFFVIVLLFVSIFMFVSCGEKTDGERLIAQYEQEEKDGNLHYMVYGCNHRYWEDRKLYLIKTGEDTYIQMYENVDGTTIEFFYFGNNITEKVHQLQLHCYYFISPGETEKSKTIYLSQDQCPCFYVWQGDGADIGWQSTYDYFGWDIENGELQEFHSGITYNLYDAIQAASKRAIENGIEYLNSKGLGDILG